MTKANTTFIDLTHSLSSETPTWDGSCGFTLTVQSDYNDFRGPDYFRTQSATLNAGIGTHMDSPAHCFQNGSTIDSLQITDLVTDCAVIRVDDIADENFLVMPEEIEKYERTNGTLHPNSFVLFFTGWSKHWNTAATYRNNLKFPSVHESTALMLLERRIAGIGIDTLSPDARGHSFPVHRAILGAGKYIVENIANAEVLPQAGARIIVLPLKIKNATESPIRLIAEVSSA